MTLDVNLVSICPSGIRDGHFERFQELIRTEGQWAISGLLWLKAVTLGVGIYSLFTTQMVIRNAFVQHLSGEVIFHLQNDKEQVKGPCSQKSLYMLISYLQSIDFTCSISVVLNKTVIPLIINYIDFVHKLTHTLLGRVLPCTRMPTSWDKNMHGILYI